MSIKWKTILGIALIELLFLGLLIWQAVQYLSVSNQAALTKRASDTVELIESVVKDAVISVDLATLDEVTRQVAELDEVVYVQIVDSSGLLAAAGQLPSSQVAVDADFQAASDGVYDTSVEITESGYSFGRLELGISVSSLHGLIAEAKQRFIIIAGLELVLVALCSWALATLLTRRITELRNAAQAAEKGQWVALRADGKRDELSLAMQAFDHMTEALRDREQRLNETIADLEDRNAELELQRQEMATLERESQEAHMLKSSIVDASLDALVSIDRDGRIIEFSKSACDILGWSREEAMGQDMATMIIPPQYHEAHQKGMAKFLATGEGPLIGKRVEVVALHRNGLEFPVELALMASHLEGEVIVTASLRDITERKANEAALIEAKSTAEQASLAKSRFLSHMSHEIRSPLNAVLGALEVLNQGSQLPPDMEKMIRIARGSGNALLHVINDVLDFSRIEAGQVEIREETFDLGPMIREVLTAMMTRPAKPDLTLAFLADASAPLNVCGDPDRIRQVLTIFVDNAFKFTEKGSITVVPTLEEEGGESLWKVSVYDTGPGIPENMIDAVFGEFEQVDAARDTGYGGTGLGLSIARQLVGLMGGRVSVTSAEGKGSCFTFTVKAAAAVKKEIPQPVPSRTHVEVGVVVAAKGLSLALADWSRQTGLSLAGTAAGFQGELNWLDGQSSAEQRILIVDSETLPALSGRPDIANQWRILKVGESTIAPTIQALGAGTLFPERLMDAVFEPSRVKPSGVEAESKCAEALALEPDDGAPDGSQHLLLVDDVEANRLVAGEVLRRRGYTVDYAENGEEAVSMAALKPYHAILMDVRMPKMNGLEATEVIRGGDGPNATTRIIALTANAEKSEIDRCRSVGMDDFISKPFQIAKLIASVAQTKTGNEDQAMTTDTAVFANEDVLSESALAQLAADTSWETIPMMLSIFVREIKTRRSAVDAAYQAGDVSEVREQAHALKSCSGTYGGARLSAVAKALEYAAAEGQTDLLPGLVTTLGVIADTTENAYSAKMTELEAKIASD